MKSIFVFILMIVSCVCLEFGSLRAQGLSLEAEEQKLRTRKWMISFTAAARISSIGNQMEKSLVNQEFGDAYINNYYFFGVPINHSVEYPKRKESGIPWDIEIRYALNTNASLAATIGNYYHGTFEGYNNIANSASHYLTLENKVWLCSMDYIFTLPDAYSGFRIGPVLAFHQVKENGTTSQEQMKTNIKPGLNLGYDASLFEKKSWFMAFSIGYTWIPPVSIGPYEKEVSVRTYNGVKDYTSTYEASKIPLSSLKVGLTMGWRI